VWERALPLSHRLDSSVIVLVLTAGRCVVRFEAPAGGPWPERWKVGGQGLVGAAPAGMAGVLCGLEGLLMGQIRRGEPLTKGRQLPSTWYCFGGLSHEREVPFHGHVVQIL
jgi:hypothetical protein